MRIDHQTVAKIRRELNSNQSIWGNPQMEEDHARNGDCPTCGWVDDRVWRDRATLNSRSIQKTRVSR